MKIKNPLNTLLLNKRNSIFVPYGNSHDKESFVEAFNADLSSLGYTLSPELIKRLKTLSRSQFKFYTLSLIRDLKELVGANYEFRPLFTNFPEENASTLNWFDRYTNLDKNIHSFSNNVELLSCGHVIYKESISSFGACPICGEQTNELLKDTDPIYKEKTPLTVIEFAEKNVAFEVIDNLLSSDLVLSENDLKMIVSCFRVLSSKKVKKLIPETIPVKETKAYFVAYILRHLKEKHASAIIESMSFTATDILRVAAALSNDNVDLIGGVFFLSFSNKERRLLLSLLEKIDSYDRTADMQKYKEIWKRLGEYLHPCSYKNKFKETCKSFKMIRSNRRVYTFNTRVEKLIEDNEFLKLEEFLSKRPGEYIRKIDLLLRNNVELKSLNNIVKEVKTKDLLIVSKQLESRTYSREIIPESFLEKKIDNHLNPVIEGLTVENTKSTIRYFIPKGSLAKLFIKEEYNFPLLNKKAVKAVLKIFSKELKTRFKGKLSKYIDNDSDSVFLDPNLKKVLLPKNLKNISTGKNIFTRGSKIPYTFGKVTRLFLYWKGSVDLDLSVTLCDKDMNIIEYSTYYQLSGTYCTHSGDVRSAPNGGAEFIDIELPRNVKYIIPSVISYSGEEFNTIHAFMGIMERNKPNSGELFEPATAKMKFDLTGSTKSFLPFVIDVEENHILITDLAVSSNARENQNTLINQFVKSFYVINDFENTYPNMYDFFRMHVESSSFSISEDSDLSISLNGDLNPTQFDIISDLMS